MKYVPLLSLLFALMVCFPATRARADADLTKGLNDLAKAVAEFLKKEGGSSINVGDFIAPPE